MSQFEREGLAEPVPAIDDLMCSVCIEILEMPVTFDCTHSICAKCWSDLKDSVEVHGRDLKCPECRQTVKEPNRVIINQVLWRLIQRNYAVQLAERSKDPTLPSSMADDFSSPRDLLREMRDERLSAQEKARETQMRRDERLARQLMEEEEMEQAARDHQLQLDEEVARALQAVDETRPVAPAPVNAADQSIIFVSDSDGEIIFDA